MNFKSSGSDDMDFYVWTKSITEKEPEIGIGLPITEEPSHTTTHTDP
jgi:hypothetical protein